MNSRSPCSPGQDHGDTDVAKYDPSSSKAASAAPLSEATRDGMVQGQSTQLQGLICF